MTPRIDIMKPPSTEQTKMTSHPEKQLQVRKFFEGKTIFMTGGTGFLGKFMLEKLMASCNVKKIYVLIREKRGQSIEERCKALRSDQIFKFRVDPSKLELITPVAGDISLPDLGISLKDRQMLIQETNIIIHSAATVKFDEPLHVAMEINVLGTQYVLKLCSQVSKLESFVYVSTAFTSSHLKRLEEMPLPPTADPYEVVQLMKEYDVEQFDTEIYESIKGGHPNSYTFTKSLSETVVREFVRNNKIPTAITKPAIIISPVSEPIELYVDGLSQGTPAVGAAMGVALNRVLPGKLSNRFPAIPVDTCTNEILIAAAEAATFDVEDKECNPRSYGIFNTTNNVITINTAFSNTVNAILKYPTLKALRPPSMVHFTTYPFLYRIQVILFELIFAAFFDLMLLMTGGKPKLLRILSKSHKTIGVLAFFLSQDWNVSGVNCLKAYNRLSREEQQIFNCNMSNIDWKAYFEKYWLGIRKWAFREDLDNLEQAKKRLKR